MSSSSSTNVRAHIFGVLAFFVTGIVTGITYGIIVGRVLGRGGDGFGIAGTIAAFPIYGVFCGIAWIVVWLLYERFAGRMTRARVLLFSATVGLVASIVLAGPRGFTLAGGAALFNYFLIALIMLGAGIHSVLVGRFSRKAEAGATPPGLSARSGSSK